LVDVLPPGYVKPFEDTLIHAAVEGYKRAGSKRRLSVLT
jgi:hypothetical protein